MDLMQQQKEAAAMDKLRQLMPQLGDMVRALALSKADWDIDQAVSMLRSFQVSHLDKVNTLNKVSSRAGKTACCVAPAILVPDTSRCGTESGSSKGHRCSLTVGKWCPSWRCSHTMLALFAVCLLACSAAKSCVRLWRRAQAQRSLRQTAAAPAAVAAAIRMLQRAAAAAVTAMRTAGAQR